MRNIIDIKSVLTQKALDFFCHKFHIPKSVHPQLPSRNQTIHERPVGKIGVYTRFFKYANFRLPLSTFLVDVLRYFRINLSQLSVIVAAKIFHFEILCRVHGIELTVGRVVSLLPVASDRSEGELEASVDRLFDEGGSTYQEDSTAGGGHDAMIEPVPYIAENGDHGTSSGDATSGKYPIRELLASSVMNAEVGVTVVATLPFITSSISATPKHEDDNPTDSVIGLNLCTICPAERSPVLPSVMTEAVITSHAVSAPSLSVPETKTKITSPVHPFVFKNSGSTETVRPDVVGPSYYAEQDLSMGSRELNTETLYQVFVSQWNVLNDSLLDDYDVSREFIDHLAPPALFSQIHEMDY
nr:putative transposase (putative), gypsy type [Tanacetum cinerariifolium]